MRAKLFVLTILVVAAPFAHAQLRPFLKGQWLDGPNRMCRYNDGTVLNMGWHICPLMLPAPSAPAASYQGGISSALDAASQRALMDAQRKLIESQTRAPVTPTDVVPSAQPATPSPELIACLQQTSDAVLRLCAEKKNCGDLVLDVIAEAQKMRCGYTSLSR